MEYLRKSHQFYISDFLPSKFSRCRWIYGTVCLGPSLVNIPQPRAQSFTGKLGQWHLSKFKKKQSFWKFSFKLLENPSYSHATTFFAFEARVVPCEQASNLLSEFKIDIDMSALAFPCVLRALLLTSILRSIHTSFLWKEIFILLPKFWIWKSLSHLQKKISLLSFTASRQWWNF